MKITNQSVVSLHYTLKNADGRILSSTEGQPPMQYLHGANTIVSGLEKALSDKAVGDQLDVVIPPEEAYGEYNEALRQTIPASTFSDISQVEPGMRFEADTTEGKVSVLVVEVNEDSVDVDCNHPMAGQELHFDVTVTDIREATEEELLNGLEGFQEEPKQQTEKH